MGRPVGRPEKYTDDSRVYLCADGRIKLQAGSDRRAIVNLLVDNRGSMTLGEIDRTYGFSVRDVVFDLVKAGWVRISPLGRTCQYQVWDHGERVLRECGKAAESCLGGYDLCHEHADFVRDTMIGPEEELLEL